MDSPIEKWNLIIGNLALKQVQATVVGFLAAVAAIILGWIPEGKYYLSHSILLCSSSVATAFIASLLQGKGICEGRLGTSGRLNERTDFLGW